MAGGRKQAEGRHGEQKQKSQDENRELVNDDCLEAELLTGFLAEPGCQNQHDNRQKENTGDVENFCNFQGFDVNGMQITKKSITQAGGWPIVIGGISGVTKAVLSFLVVLWLVKDVVLH